jgi:hypothetical protein
MAVAYHCGVGAFRAGDDIWAQRQVVGTEDADPPAAHDLVDQSLMPDDLTDLLRPP